jgi:urease gamma subunit
MEVKLGLRRTKKGSKIQAPESLTFISVKITRLIKSGKL